MVSQSGFNPLYKASERPPTSEAKDADTDELASQTPSDSAAEQAMATRGIEAQEVAGDFKNGFHKHHASIAWFIPPARKYRAMSPSGGVETTWSDALRQLNAALAAEDGVSLDDFTIKHDCIKLKIGSRVHRYQL